MPASFFRLAHVLAAASVLSLAACGGGGGDDMPVSPTPDTPTSPAPTDPAPGSGAAADPLLPAELAAQPAAANCNGLRSGRYAVVIASPTGANAAATTTLQIDAQSLQATVAGANATWTPNGNCRYSTDEGRTDVVVSQAGVLLVRGVSNGIPMLLIGLPQQSHTLAELAGSWNAIGLEKSTAGYVGVGATFDLDADGGYASLLWCRNDTTWSVSGGDCNNITSQERLQANADGGFDTVDATSGAVTGRLFAYHSAAGWMAVKIEGNGSLRFWTPVQPAPLGAVGDTSTNWTYYLDQQLAATGAVTQAQNTTTAVDAAAKTRTRLNKGIDGSNEHTETLTVDAPRSGFLFRAGATVKTTAGADYTVQEYTGLTLTGMGGVTPLLLPGSRSLGISVNQP